MIGVTTHPEPDKFGIYSGTSRFGMLHFFNHHHARAVAEHEAISVLVPRTTGTLRLIVSGRQRSCGTKSPQADGRSGHLSPSDQHNVGLVVTDHIRGEANIVSPCGTGSHYSNIWTFESVANGKRAGDHIDY